MITTEKRKAILYAIKLQNTSVFIDTLVESFGGMLRFQFSWDIGSACLQKSNAFGLDCSCLKKDRSLNDDRNSRPKWEKLSIRIMLLAA